MDKHSEITLNTGNAMPVMGLGTWELTKDTPETIAYALECGFPMIDTSGDYGTEPGIARGLKVIGVERDDVYVVTKVEETEDAYISAKANVAELELDYADLVLIHRPPEQGAGEELWEGLLQAREEGYAKDIGVSNYTEDEIDHLIAVTGEVPAVNQIEWTPFGHSNSMKKYCDENQIVIQAYSPLTRATRLDDGLLEEIARRYGKSPAQLLIRWDIDNGIVPLPKANQKEHIREDIDVFDFEITDDDAQLLESCNQKYSALGEHLAYA